ncbi:MAG: KH domain-containing protein [Acidobacteriota bacterium]|nr:KH domain-containing protein [Acidobacteriota bacterium]
MAADFEAFLKDVLSPMLDHPEALRVEVREAGRKREVVIFAEQADRGRIIGKSGRMISSLRTLVQAAGEKQGLVVNLELFDEDEKDRPRRDRPAHSDTPAEA